LKRQGPRSSSMLMSMLITPSGRMYACCRANASSRESGRQQRCYSR
jgi:hypothetical protein